MLAGMDPRLPINPLAFVRALLKISENALPAALTKDPPPVILSLIKNCVPAFLKRMPV
jgi:hypothetical protein